MIMTYDYDCMLYLFFFGKQLSVLLLLLLLYTIFLLRPFHTCKPMQARSKARDKMSKH